MRLEMSLSQLIEKNVERMNAADALNMLPVQRLKEEDDIVN